MFKQIIVFRGGGDIATGAIHKLHRSGFRVVVLECAKPTAIRRKVCFSEAVYDGETSIENVKARLVENKNEIEQCFNENVIPILVDPDGELIDKLRPDVIVDGILEKRNIGTHINMAPITIALGPGFVAGRDVTAVIETMRGHDLGRIILQGEAMPNTGTPGVIAGVSKERVIYSTEDGVIKNQCKIGDLVEKGQSLAEINEVEIKATITGVLRGIIKNGSYINKGLKIADIDPRKEEQKNCFTISDKARSIGGAVLEAILWLSNIKKDMRGE